MPVLCRLVPATLATTFFASACDRGRREEFPVAADPPSATAGEVVHAGRGAPPPPAACRPIQCVTTPGDFSKDDDARHPGGYDVASTKLFHVPDCSLWTDRYAADKRDVFILSPQSCGNCGGDYTGFYWAPLGARDSATFVMMPGGYGRDAVHAYYRWSRSTIIEGADVATFEVLWCGDSPEDPSGEDVAHDKTRYYVDGEVVPSTRVTERWRR